MPAGLSASEMKRRRLWLGGLLLLALTAWAGPWLVNFAGRESGYCWLVFGPRGEHRLLLHQSGDEWFLDRDGDGSFKGPDERLGYDPHISLTNLGGVDYTLTSLRAYHDQTLGDRCYVQAEVRGAQTFRQLADIGLGRSRLTAGLGHFNGPLTVQAQTVCWELPPGLALRRGDRSNDVRVLIGTVDRATRCWTTVSVMESLGASRFPTNVHPFVDVEYPAQDAGGAALHVRYPLKQFC